MSERCSSDTNGSVRITPEGSPIAEHSEYMNSWEFKSDGGGGPPLTPSQSESSKEQMDEPTER